MTEPLVVRVRKLREAAKEAANNPYSAAPLIEELAGLLEESILSNAEPTDFDKGFAAGHEAACEESLAAGCPD